MVTTFGGVSNYVINGGGNNDNGDSTTRKFISSGGCNANSGVTLNVTKWLL